GFKKATLYHKPVTFCNRQFVRDSPNQNLVLALIRLIGNPKTLNHYLQNTLQFPFSVCPFLVAVAMSLTFSDLPKDLVPLSFPDILKDLNKEVLSAQPKDLYLFCANYFNRKLEEQKC
ncbi:hypothetical protein HK096_001567, partial [Nowakowskiella sp. JEL0078]